MFRFPEGTGKFGGNAFSLAGKVARPRCCLVCPPQRNLNMIVKYIAFSITSTAVLFVSSLLTFAP
jgi:hypothetical protein